MNKFCNNCGQELNENVKFCLNCGHEINKEIKENKITNTQNKQKKSKVVAGLLGILLGSFGIHNFYLGYNGKAVAQLLITLLSFGLLSMVTSLWGLIEGIMILTGTINVDAEGNTLTE